MRKIVMAAVMALVGLSMQSCLDDDDRCHGGGSIIGPNAIVTMKTVDGSMWFQLDDSTRLYPVNVNGGAYGKEVRAFVNYRDVSKRDEVKAGVRNVWVNWVDTVLTKDMLAVTVADSALIANDPVEIVDDWMTVCEDGYLTLRFRTHFGGNVTHKVNLVATDEPYVVRLSHNACGDRSTRVADGTVAFRLNQLPDTEGKTVDLTLKWTSFSGEKSVKFKYCTRKD